MRPLSIYRTARSLSLLALTLFVTGASARADIIDGTEVVSGDFSEVFAITSAAENGSGARKLCTAVLVHPRVLLTAAHCLPADPKAPVTVLEGPNAHAPTATFTSISTARNTTFFSTKDEIEQNGFDIGVVVLAKDLPGSDVKTGAKLTGLGSVLDSDDQSFAHTNGFTVVGFGGSKSTAVDNTTGVKRSGETTLVELSPIEFSTDGPVSGISRGDSGGPAYITDSNGSRRLLGIASGSPKDSKGDYASLPNISYYVGMRPKLACWIEKNSGFSLPPLAGSIGCARKMNPAHGPAVFGAK
jgi:V8-like Glu-specific endopeptidase